jgi:transglutaminase-like putative cysteine protease
MRLFIRHETIYRYSKPIAYTIQQLRLSPRNEPHQHTLSWHIATAGRCEAFIDAFGNQGHMLTMTGSHDEIRIVATGSVEVLALDRGRLTSHDALSPLVFTVPTRLTETTDTIVAFARQYLSKRAGTAELLALAAAICGAVDYQGGATGVTSTAADALECGQGVCQDHAHLFIACCHTLSVPARYVSGYIDPGNTAHAESHAWVDVWVDEDGFAGWVTIDVTHAKLAGESHCRLAIGRDYESAAPVRGMRRGGGEESLSVSVNVGQRTTDQ